MLKVLGQEFAERAFKRSYENNKISHAYIIEGPDGIGKSIFALNIASTILCSSSDKPCGVCPSCRKIQHGNHPDVRIVSAGSKSIGVDAVRKLIEDIYIKPYEGDKKVIIIKKAETITIEGQNAILKTLEEPPEGTTIIMLTTNLRAMLDTIQSRCQVFHLGRTGTDRIRDYLIKKGTDREKAEAAAAMSDGILGNALRFFDKNYMDLREKTIEVSRKIVRAGELDIINNVDFFLSHREEIYLILDIMTSWLRDIAVFKLTKDKDIIINRDFYGILVEESKILSYGRIRAILDIIKDTGKKLNQYLNYQLTIEVMLLNIQEV